MAHRVESVVRRKTQKTYLVETTHVQRRLYEVRSTSCDNARMPIEDLVRLNGGVAGNLIDSTTYISAVRRKP
jgi:hypothetical protein